MISTHIVVAAAVDWTLVITAAIIILIYLIWKIVFEPTLTVSVDGTHYQRGETVGISGHLQTSDGLPLANKTIGLAITPEGGDAYTLPSVQTDASGNFTSSWVVPNDADMVLHTLTAASMAVQAQDTFTQIK